MQRILRKTILGKISGVSQKLYQEVFDELITVFEKEKYEFEREKTAQEKEIVLAILNFMPEFVEQYGVHAVEATIDHRPSAQLKIC